MGNVSLGAALAGHAERVKADSNTIMTVVVTPSSTLGPQSLQSHLAVAVNAVDGQLYSYVRRERFEEHGGWLRLAGFVGSGRWHALDKRVAPSLPRVTDAAGSARV